MELYIKIKDGKPFEHPILGNNFRQAFPSIDTNNLPPEFARFVRVAAPVLGPFEVYVECVYELVDGVYTDVHKVRQMTNEEKAAVHQRVIDAWALIPNAFNFTAWVLDEAALRMVPPTPRPVEEGKIFRWSGADNNWKEAPAKPEGEGQYAFDFAQWVWIQVNV
jgi:hypothetical protein